MNLANTIVQPSDMFLLSNRAAWFDHGPADITDDAVVNSADLATLLSQWGATGLADINGDSVINSADLARLLASWGPVN